VLKLQDLVIGRVSQGRGRTRGFNSSGNGNMEESMSSKFPPKEILLCVFLMPPIPIVLGCSFPFLLGLHICLSRKKASISGDGT
ncbi:Os04g0435325, partial [Oryza sativa Japonica Group]